MTTDAKWPLSNSEQDTVAIHSMKRMLERMFDALPDETRATYTQPFDDYGGGSVEFSFICDHLYEIELNNLLDLVNNEMRDGSPRVSVAVHYIFDVDTRARLIAKWEVEKEEYPEAMFMEHFEVVVTFDYTKGDWEKLVGPAVKEGNDAAP